MTKAIQRWIYKTVVDGFFSPDCSNYNSLAVRRTCRTKSQGRARFAADAIPHAAGAIFINPWKAFSFVKKHGFPVVIKPDLSSFSRGSFFPINNYQELCSAILGAKLYWPKTVIETYIVGDNYRITAYDGKVVAASRRFEPFVDGNGKNTIAQLIDQENKVREAMGIYPVMHPLIADKKVIKYLKKQRLTLESVPKSGERIKLFHRVALSPGGIVENLDLEKVTDKNRALCKKILDLFEAQIFGIDLIMEKGPYVDWDQQKCAVLEVNSRPYMKLHEYPRYGPKPDLSEYYRQLESLAVEDKDVF